MTDFTELAQFVMKYGFDVNGIRPSSTSDALSRLQESEKESLAQWCDKYYKSDVAGLRSAYAYLQDAVSFVEKECEKLRSSVNTLPENRKVDLTSLHPLVISIPDADDWDSLERAFNVDRQAYFDAIDAYVAATPKVRDAVDEWEAANDIDIDPFADVEPDPMGPIDSTRHHFKMTTAWLAAHHNRPIEDKNAQATLEGRRTRARDALTKLWAEFQDAQKSGTKKGPAEPSPTDTHRDVGEVKMDCLASAEYWLAGRLQECMGTGASISGAIWDFIGMRKWRFDISPARYVNATTNLPDFLARATDEGSIKATVFFTYTDRNDSPWRLTDAACDLSLTVTDTGVPFDLKDGDQYVKDGEARLEF